MKITDAFPSKYLAAADVPDDADLILTIKAVEMEVLGQGEKADSKPVIYSNEYKKGFVCNKTNSKTIMGLYGAETDNWIGKRIGLFATEVDSPNGMTLALRVRMKAPRAAGNGAPLPENNTLTLDQAKTALASVGIDFDTFKKELRAWKKLAEGERLVYVPGTDTVFVNHLIDSNTPEPEAEAEL